ncbi:MAG: DUF1911 domain-containing protein, partial [Reinekea sp.]|nr:DUF1911 domain-containing protein [Reinekea sp.]
RNILKRRVSYLICSYTLGTEPSQLSSIGKTILKDMIRYIESNSRKSDLIAPDDILEQYIECTWILSFAYFFNADRSEVENIIPHIPYTGKDKLIDRLIAAIIPEHPVSQGIAFPDVYKPICDAMGVYDKDARDVLVQLFLKKYYPSLKKHDVTWYDSHKEKDPEYNFHTGYWVFELAAIAVAIGWDVTDFRDNVYYPKDLADWKRDQLKLATMER